MNDEEYLQNVDLLLESLWQGHQAMERAHGAFMRAGEAFLAEARRDGNMDRLRAIYRDIEKANKKMVAHNDSQCNRLDALSKLLREWKSPGREYLRFVEQARRLWETYRSDAGALRDARLRIYDAANAFNKFLQAARR
jgi:hypothetical protein